MLEGVLLALTVLLAIAIGWVATDAARRGRSWIAWAALLTAIGTVGVIPWMIVRRHSPIITSARASRRWAMRLVAVPLAVLHAALTVAVAALLFVPVLFQNARVQGHAMEPTLADRDRLLVNTSAYRSSAPQKGDIVMLRYPLDPRRSFIKRVIAAEGDRIRIVDGVVYVNEAARDDSFIPPDHRSHETWGPKVVPQGGYFVMGDRRNNSSDSRHWGFVPRQHIVGKVEYCWWPADRARRF